ncbi:MAG TPA: hypothetical protein VD886_11025, partial [Herpetosiphonaceae bacterium]|nr:hypothetical protein [Herpetosiphonaceae bacterium]
ALRSPGAAGGTAGTPGDPLGAGGALADLAGLLGPWLALALLPMPQASELRSPLDLAAAWLLLEAPWALLVLRRWRSRADEQLVAARALAAALVALPGLLVALFGLSAATGSVTVAASGELLRRQPIGGLALAAWAAALVPALLVGPWHCAGAGAERLALAGRRLGHLLLLALALLPAWIPANGASLDLPAWRRDGRLPLLITAAALWLGLLLIHRLGWRRSPIVWGRAVWLVAAVALIGMALVETGF